MTMSKKKPPIKKYTIHIFSARALREECFDLPKDEYAVITLSIFSFEYAELLRSRNWLAIPFIDTTNPKDPRRLTNARARKIIRYINNLPNTVTDLYICCDWGQSRSAAVAASLLLASGRTDAPVWNNPNYRPNRFVFRKMCHTLGIRMPLHKLYWRVIRNRLIRTRLFKKYSKHELWEILF